jgi:hypothetical protein
MNDYCRKLSPEQLSKWKQQQSTDVTLVPIYLVKLAQSTASRVKTYFANNVTYTKFVTAFLHSTIM